MYTESTEIEVNFRFLDLRECEFMSESVESTVYFSFLEYNVKLCVLKV